jgi:ATP-dependent protease ClpP protease subunit
MKIDIDGVIGWDTTATDVKEQIAEAGAEQLDVQISSPGGLVFEGIEIFNAIRNHPGGSVGRVTSLAGSAASYIAMAVESLIVADNAVMMIHNPQGVAIGDHNEMRAAADVTERLTDMLAKGYSDKTGASIEDTLSVMGNETWMFGQEIVDNGFADGVQGGDSDVDGDLAVATARLSFEMMVAKIKGDEKRHSEDIQRFQALMPVMSSQDTQ